jgi:hypothetical protein
MVISSSKEATKVATKMRSSITVNSIPHIIIIIIIISSIIIIIRTIVVIIVIAKAVHAFITSMALRVPLQQEASFIHPFFNKLHQQQQSHPKLNCFTEWHQLLLRMVCYAVNNKMLLLELFKIL